MAFQDMTKYTNYYYQYPYFKITNVTEGTIYYSSFYASSTPPISWLMDADDSRIAVQYIITDSLGYTRIPIAEYVTNPTLSSIISNPSRRNLGKAQILETGQPRFTGFETFTTTSVVKQREDELSIFNVFISNSVLNPSIFQSLCSDANIISMEEIGYHQVGYYWSSKDYKELIRVIVVTLNVSYFLFRLTHSVNPPTTLASGEISVSHIDSRWGLNNISLYGNGSVVAVKIPYTTISPPSHPLFPPAKPIIYDSANWSITGGSKKDDYAIDAIQDICEISDYLINLRIVLKQSLKTAKFTFTSLSSDIDISAIRITNVGTSSYSIKNQDTLSIPLANINTFKTISEITCSSNEPYLKISKVEITNVGDNYNINIIFDHAQRSFIVTFVQDPLSDTINMVETSLTYDSIIINNNSPVWIYNWDSSATATIKSNFETNLSKWAIRTGNAESIKKVSMDLDNFTVTVSLYRELIITLNAEFYGFEKDGVLQPAAEINVLDFSGNIVVKNQDCWAQEYAILVKITGNNLPMISNNVSLSYDIYSKISGLESTYYIDNTKADFINTGYEAPDIITSGDIIKLKFILYKDKSGYNGNPDHGPANRKVKIKPIITTKPSIYKQIEVTIDIVTPELTIKEQGIGYYNNNDFIKLPTKDGAYPNKPVYLVDLSWFSHITEANWIKGGKIYQFTKPLYIYSEFETPVMDVGDDGFNIIANFTTEYYKNSITVTPSFSFNSYNNYYSAQGETDSQTNKVEIVSGKKGHIRKLEIQLALIAVPKVGETMTLSSSLEFIRDLSRLDSVFPIGMVLSVPIEFVESPPDNFELLSCDYKNILNPISGSFPEMNYITHINLTTNNINRTNVITTATQGSKTKTVTKALSEIPQNPFVKYNINFNENFGDVIDDISQGDIQIKHVLEIKNELTENITTSNELSITIPALPKEHPEIINIDDSKVLTTQKEFSFDILSPNVLLNFIQSFKVKSTFTNSILNNNSKTQTLAIPLTTSKTITETINNVFYEAHGTSKIDLNFEYVLKDNFYQYNGTKSTLQQRTLSFDKNQIITKDLDYDISITKFDISDIIFGNIFVEANKIKPYCENCSIELTIKDKDSGQVVFNNKATNQTFNISKQYPYSLSNFLPDRTYNYEIRLITTKALGTTILHANPAIEIEEITTTKKILTLELMCFLDINQLGYVIKGNAIGLFGPYGNVKVYCKIDDRDGQILLEEFELPKAINIGSISSVHDKIEFFYFLDALLFPSHTAYRNDCVITVGYVY